MRLALRPAARVTVSPERIEAAIGRDEATGYLIGYWSADDLDDPPALPARHITAGAPFELRVGLGWVL